jgi:hypothetical protein
MKVKVGIVTTKDLAFITDRVPFAHGIAATCGLEILVGGRVILDQRTQQSSKEIEAAYRRVVKEIMLVRDNIAIERKENEEGNLLGFCIDWRLSSNWDEARRKTMSLLNACKEDGLYVVESDISPFANVFPFPVDKGSAFQRLRTELNVTGPTMYLGDSEVDNTAFQLADISVGVKHRRNMPPLQCKYRLEFLELENFLSRLIEADFNFQDDMLERNTQN